jgi:hypothetical protein
MSRVASIAIQKAVDILAAEEGLGPALERIAREEGETPPTLESGQVMATAASVELLEAQGRVRYPYLQVNCERVINGMREKFRRFSGTVRIGVEARCSSERLASAEREARWLADALAEVLDHNRGDWGDGFYYGGGYEITFGATRTGGRNFVQTAKVAFEVSVAA